MLSSLLCPAMPWNTDVLNLLLAGGHLPLTFAVPYIQGRTAINCGSGSLCSDVGSKHIGRLHVHSRICNPYYNDPSARMQPLVLAFFFTWSLLNRAAPGSLSRSHRHWPPLCRDARPSQFAQFFKYNFHKMPLATKRGDACQRQASQDIRRGRRRPSPYG